MQCETINSHVKSFFFHKNFIFENFIFSKCCPILFYFVLFYFILFYFIKFYVFEKFCDEQCPKSDSGTVLSQKLAKCTMCTATVQPTRTGRTCVAVSQPAQRRVVVGPPGRFTAPGCSVAAPRARPCVLCRTPAPSVPRACAQRLLLLVTIL